ncbi:hypothetical protein B566_EDAN016118 [Ephemera danica]|nr:hypothetical protein B566_EDAN016118 [Ephemera danica]
MLEKKMMDRASILFMWTMSIMVSIVCAAYDEIEVNYDIGHYKFLKVNQTLELKCKNLLNRDPPSWTYHSRLYKDPRMRFYTDVGESRLVISNATAEDAGQYRCSIDHEYNLKTFHYNRTIEVIANEIRDVKAEEEKDSIKLLCDVRAYPSATVIWKIDYDKVEIKPQQVETDEDYSNSTGDEDKVFIDKTEGRWTLGPYKGVNNAELIIANATENDNGKYYCVARNFAGEKFKE